MQAHCPSYSPRELERNPGSARGSRAHASNALVGALPELTYQGARSLVCGLEPFQEEVVMRPSAPPLSLRPIGAIMRAACVLTAGGSLAANKGARA
jgi:hypothetical protein